MRNPVFRYAVHGPHAFHVGKDDTSLIELMAAIVDVSRSHDAGLVIEIKHIGWEKRS